MTLTDHDKRLIRWMEHRLTEEFGLSDMGVVVTNRWLKKIACEDPNNQLVHVRNWLLLVFNKRTRPRSKEGYNYYQQGCPKIVPFLEARAFWEADHSQILGACIETLEHEIDVVHN